MDFDQFVSEYIAEDHDFEQLSVMVLEGCRVWYPLTAEAEKQKLQEVMEKAARAAAGAHRFGRYVFLSLIHIYGNPRYCDRSRGD